MAAVFEHKSYRSFLKELLVEGKAQSPPLTLSRLGKKLGMSVSALQMVMEGERNLTVHRLHEIAHALGLNEKEAEYFEALIHFEQATSSRERQFYARRLKRNSEKQKVSVRRVASADLLSDWYMPSLLVFFLDSEGEPDFAKIERALGLNISQSKNIFARLQTLGFLRKNAADKKFHLVYDKLAAAFPQEQFLSKLLREVERRLPKDFRSGESYFEAHTMNICAERYPEFVEDYKTLMARYIELGPRTEKPLIYQSVLAFLPVL